MPTLDVDTTLFARAIDAYQLETAGNIDRALMRGFSGFARRLIGITPPAKGARGRNGTLTKDDHKRGLAAIGRDLSELFIPVRITKKRKEEYRDVAGIHRKIFNSYKRAGKLLKNPAGVGNFYHVDGGKFKVLKKSLEKRVGSLAAGWLVGALMVKATGIPVWVKRHAPGGGTASLKPAKSPRVFEIMHHEVPPGLAPEMDRRAATAARYAASAMFAEVKQIVAKKRILKAA